MTRPFTSGRTAAAAAGALAGGTIVATSPIELDLADVDLSLALATAVILIAVKRWFKRYEGRTKADVRLLAQHHRLRSEELDRRERALAGREASLTRSEGSQALRMTSLANALDTTRSELVKEKAEHETLAAAYREVTGDYNALIEHVLRQGHERFTARTECACGPLPPEPPHRSDEHQRGPVAAPVTYLRPREHHPSA